MGRQHGARHIYVDVAQWEAERVEVGDELVSQDEGVVVTVQRSQGLGRSPLREHGRAHDRPSIRGVECRLSARGQGATIVARDGGSERSHLEELDHDMIVVGQPAEAVHPDDRRGRAQSGGDAFILGLGADQRRTEHTLLRSEQGGDPIVFSPWAISGQTMEPREPLARRHPGRASGRPR